MDLEEVKSQAITETKWTDKAHVIYRKSETEYDYVSLEGWENPSIIEEPPGYYDGCEKIIVIKPQPVLIISESPSSDNTYKDKFESEPASTEEDPIERMIRERSLNSQLKIKINMCDLDVYKSLEIWFIGFIPSKELLKPFRRLLQIEGFQELRGPATRPNNFNLTLPNEGWSVQEVALALKESWEKDIEVEIQEE